MITNSINKKRYIGRSSDLSRRFMEHKTPKNIENKISPLYADIREFGLVNFEFSVLEFVSDVTMLPEKEVEWIKKLSPEYNINEGGMGNKGHVLSDDARQRISKKLKEIWSEKTQEEKETIYKNLTGPKAGYQVSEETRQKIRLNMIGKKMPSEVKLKISKALSGQPRPNLKHRKSIKVQKEGIETLVFESVKDTAEYFNVDPSCITRSLKSKTTHYRGYILSYHNK